MPEECAQFGWPALAKMLGVSKRTCMRRKKEMKETGAIMYTYKKNSAGVRYKAMYFFPSIVKAHLIKESTKNEK